MLHLFNIFHENKDSDNCAQLLEEECIKMFGTKFLNYEHDCNVVSMNSLNTHDANDMQNYKLGDEIFVMSTTYCNDHDWGDSSYDLENLFQPHDEYEIDNSVCNNI